MCGSITTGGGKEAETMPKHTIKTSLELVGGDQYRAEIKSVCADLKYLGKHIEAVNQSVTQLNKSLRELVELRKQAI